MELTSLQTSQTRTTTNNSSQSSKASESSQQSSPTFKLDEVQDILLEEGFDRTLDTSIFTHCVDSFQLFV